MMVRQHGFRDLLAWQRAMDLVEVVYRTTHIWPKEELYGLTNQVRRAVVSVPANIAEGQGRNAAKEFAYFLAIAKGSLCEVETLLMIAERLGYRDSVTTEDLLARITEIGRLLYGLRQSLSRAS
jgi:four helix bundle protein